LNRDPLNRTTDPAMAPLMSGDLIPEPGRPVTTGDRLRLADTDLILEVEGDYTTAGDARTGAAGAVDTVITQALILDWWGIVKADVGLRNGRIVAIGKAGDPDTQAGVTIAVGPGTDAIAGEGCILTAGCIDTHVPFIGPQQIDSALASGVTTLMGGGTGPANGSHGTPCTPGAFHLARMLQAAEGLPVNLGFFGTGQANTPEAIEAQIRAGAGALALQGGAGTTAAAIDRCLTVADQCDVPLCLHTGSRQGAGLVEDTRRAIDGRTVRTHGSGGDHGLDLDLLTLCGQANVLPSTSAGLASPAEAILHDLGAIAIIASDSQATGRAGALITRSVQTAHTMKVQRGALPEDSARNDNTRLKRYIAKTTINPAIAHGIDHQVGSVEVGKLADLVLWKPGFFGVKPELVIKGGSIVWAQMGVGHASFPMPGPVHGQPMFAAFGKALAPSCLSFVSQAALEADLPRQLGLQRACVPVQNSRGGISKGSMKHNTALPRVEVDPQASEVLADGERLTGEPAAVLPLAQRYVLL
jgi:urease subunit alpha